ncbi:MAG: DUF115 domain-containing protein [Spirochaetaceae bacterium]|jgi:hypothetical protein|nr:DUF115 domain-containing protein [Spirochaetaceae bacterium]
MRRYFEENILALSDRDPALCNRISRAKTGVLRYRMLDSRSGETVPALLDGKGASHPLHSLVDPRREGTRLINLAKDEGFLIFLGLGGGFQVAAALERADIQKVLVIDYDIYGIAQLLDSRDYHRFFQDTRFHLLIDPSAPQVERYVLDNYQPVLAGGMRVLPLRTRTVFDRQRFAEAGAAVDRAISTISRDYSVQAYFGTRWFSNIIRNLLRAEQQDGPIPSIRRAAISAAGPSLDLQLPRLAEKRNDFFLIATDTSISSLFHAGLEPDAVISIDCQHISYYHFMPGLPDRVPLYLDLASPPLVASFSSHPRFFSGGHPFTRYISRYWRPLPLLDTSGGNVTYAALSLADMLGAEQVALYGADFSYPLGRAYSRGTYLFPYFAARQNRLSPLETLFSGFLFRSPELVKVNREEHWYYENPTLREYRKLLEEKTGNIRALVVPVKGLGAPLALREQQAPPPHTIRLFAPGGSSVRAADFLFEYGEKLRNLPKVAQSAWAYLRRLTSEESLLLATLLPGAVAIKRRNPGLKTAELLEETVTYYTREIEKVLNSRQPPAVP